jgi:hypothetical protein
MNRASILPLAIVLATTCAIGQDTVTRASADSGLLTRPLHIDSANCPIGLQVSHLAGLPIGMNADGDGRPVTGPAINGRPLTGPAVNGAMQGRQVPILNQRIHLTMTNSLSQDIVSAQITVHGFSDKWRAISLSDATHAPDLAKTVEVALDVKGNNHASRDLSMNHFTAVTAIDLNSVTYADGSTWHTLSPGACSVTPDLAMLVTASR